MISTDRITISNNGRRIVRAEEAQAWQDGFQFLTEARRSAEKIISSAEEKRETEYRKGFREGHEAGMAAAAEKVAQTVASVDRYLGSLEGEIGDLAMGIVRQVFGSFGDADLVGRLASEALTNFRRAKHLKVTVHPDVAERVRGEVTRITAREGLAAAVVVETDPGMSRTGCRLASEFATVDAGLETQLAALAKALPGKGGGAS